MNRIVSIFLLISITLTFFLTSCSNKTPSDTQTPGSDVQTAPEQPSKPATGLLVYKNNAISNGMFLFLLSQTKSTYLYSSTGKLEDNAEIWDKKGKDDITVAKTLFDETLNSALSIIYFSAVAQENGISLSSNETKEITQALDTMVQAYGSRNEFNNQMLKYGVGYNSLRDFYKIEKLAQKGAALILDENGKNPITDDDVKDYYKKNFITIRHLYLNNIYKKDDTQTKLSQEESQAISKKADEIMAEIQNGSKLSDFKDLTDDGVLSETPEGITIPLGELLDMYSVSSSQEQNIFYTYYYLFSNIKGFAEAALTKKTGEVTRVDNDQVGIFLVERTPLDMKMYDSYKDPIREFILRPNKMSEIVTDLRGKNVFTIDEKTLASYSIKSAPVLEQAQMQPPTSPSNVAP